MVKKKTKLNENRLLELSFEVHNTAIVLIKNDIESYCFVHYINNTVGLQLARDADFNFWNESTNEKLNYPIYVYFDEENDLLYIVIQIRKNTNTIDKTLDFYDKIMLINGRDHAKAGKEIENKGNLIQGSFITEFINFTVAEEKNKLKEYKKELRLFLENYLFPQIDTYFYEQKSKEKAFLKHMQNAVGCEEDNFFLF